VKSATTVSDPRIAQVPIRAVSLEVVEGPDRRPPIRIAQPVFVVGTGESADLRLTDSTVSREHLRLHLTDDGLTIHDGGSRNGTWVGGLRIESALVVSDVRLTLGATTIVIRVEAAATELEVSASSRFGDALGVSPAMRYVFALLERASVTELTVLLEGESGVGKEVLAHAIHRSSTRGQAPFVPVDCGAIPASLLESELFGHVRGAFTGASVDRQGLFLEANGGTLFLDEIGELPLDLQPKLLRALEQREIRPVGSNRTVPIDVRVVAATNRGLHAAVERGEFREDLLYRLSVVRVVVPPLRDRREDILPLAKRFLAKMGYAGDLPRDVEGMLFAYAWPGNVRELSNVVQRFAALGARDRETLLASPSRADASLVPADALDAPYHEARQRVIESFERAYVEHVLARTDGVIVRAAEQSGMARASFYRMLERLGLRGR
jgi:transcriptional regulator with GAF, ATPase, and Fis domain